MSENEVMVKAIKAFSGAEGFKTPESEPFKVSRQRFADLKANNLVIDASEAGAEGAITDAAEAIDADGAPEAEVPSADAPEGQPAARRRGRNS